MYDIFQRLLDEKGLKASDVSRATGIKSPVFSEWKKGKSIPKHDKMVKIADFLGVTEEYLRTGKDQNVDYLYSDKNGDLLIEVTRRTMDIDFARLLRYYTELNCADKKTVDDMIEFLHNKSKE